MELTCLSKPLMMSKCRQLPKFVTCPKLITDVLVFRTCLILAAAEGDLDMGKVLMNYVSNRTLTIEERQEQ